MLDLYPAHRFVYQYPLGNDWHHGFYVKEVTKTDREPYSEALLNAVGR